MVARPSREQATAGRRKWVRAFGATRFSRAALCPLQRGHFSAAPLLIAEQRTKASQWAEWLSNASSHRGDQ